MDSPACDPDKCERTFGCGFASYRYKFDDIEINRNMSVKPSADPYDGASAILLTASIRNRSGHSAVFKYTEGIRVNYREIQFQSVPAEKQKVRYDNKYRYDEGSGVGIVDITGMSDDPAVCVGRDKISPYEMFPPAMFIRPLSDGGKIFRADDVLGAEYQCVIDAGGKKEISMLIGYFDASADGAPDEIIRSMSRNEAHDEPDASAYAAEWKRILPQFADEKDSGLKQELQWHAYVLEAMATYSEFYKETKIPQGTIYDYFWGAHASARDHFQHALPMVYYNAPLAKSVLRYMMKRTTPCGEIKLMEKGCGYACNERYFTSDQQLFFFMLFSEYLRVTEDYGFLEEIQEFYPLHSGAVGEAVDFAEKCFDYLHDEIGVGEHGLVKLLNSDWNDAVYYIVDVPYNMVVLDGESHMNTAMALYVLKNMAGQMYKAARALKEENSIVKIKSLAAKITYYRTELSEAFMKDLGNRKFPRRMYFNGRAYGDDNMFLEPQGYTLLADVLGTDADKNLYHEIQTSLYDNEKIGAREQERPEFDDEGFDPGSRENGGFWWALNGPVILGVARFDKAEARRLLKNMTLKNLSQQFPEYWSSYWSAADNLESSLIPQEGLPDQSLDYADMPVFCAHPHAWILHCYFVLVN